MKKKLLTLLMCFCMVTVLMYGCGNTSEETSANADQNEQAADEPGEVVGQEEAAEPEESNAEPTFPERVGGELQVGDEFTLGTFEQDNDTSNGEEDIEWIVIEKIGNTYLCLSKYVLDYRQYDQIVDNVHSWGNSDIRYWLNNYFYTASFTPEEQKYILDTNNLVYEWESWDTANLIPVNYTDKVCLINYGQEIDKWSHYVDATEYAVAQADVLNQEFLYRSSANSDTFYICEYWYIMSINVDRARGVMNSSYNPLESLSQRPDYSEIDYYGEEGKLWGAYITIKYAGIRPVITVTLSE